MFVLRSGKLALLLFITFCLSLFSAQVAKAETSTLDTIKSRGTLIAGVRADLPPYGTVTKDGKFVGYDVAVFEYFAKKLGVKLDLRQATSQTMIPLLQTGAIDIGPSSAPSIKREETVDFSIVSAWDPTEILVSKSSGLTKAKPSGLYPIKSFALVNGTYWGTIVEKMYPNAKFIFFQEYPTAVLAVKSGKAEATVLSLSGTSRILHDNPDLALLPKPIALDAVAFPVRENDSKWRKWINQTLQEMWKSGQLQQDYRTYFDAKPFFHLWSPYMLQPGMEN